jgi:hypothetical protein
METNDLRISSIDERRGVCHISDVLRVVLERIPAMTQSGMDRCPRPAITASNIMPAPGVVADY